jgi:FAD/FMN-containing dehydrogenase
LNALGVAMRLIHVESGIKLYELNDLLDKLGLALITMGGSSGQSLAGVLSTSAHGMDIDRGPIPDMVRAIHLVAPGGVQH